MTHNVDVSQLHSLSNGGSFLNVDTEHGHIEVWTSSYSKLTILFRSNKLNIIRLIQFDDLDWAYEWMIENKCWFDEFEVL